MKGPAIWKALAIRGPPAIVNNYALSTTLRCLHMLLLKLPVRDCYNMLQRVATWERSFSILIEVHPKSSTKGAPFQFEKRLSDLVMWSIIRLIKFSFLVQINKKIWHVPEYTSAYRRIIKQNSCRLSTFIIVCTHCTVCALCTVLPRLTHGAFC